MLDQMFPDRRDRHIRPSIRASPWVVSQLHGISGWAVSAGACPGRGARNPRKPNFQTSDYGITVFSAQNTDLMAGAAPECISPGYPELYFTSRVGWEALPPAQRYPVLSRNLIPVAAPAAVGCGFAAYAWFADGTGVTGSAGAALALIGSFAVAIGILVAGLTARQGAIFGILAGLIVLGAVLTAVAGFFLMQYGLAAAMALTLVGLVFVLSRPAPARRPV